jgi:predicted Zn-dependent protease
MTHRRFPLRAGKVAALLLALLPLSSTLRAPHSRISIASGGLVANPLSPRSAERERVKAAVRRRLAEGSGGTYIAEMLAERDSALARWPDRKGKPLTVWIQWAGDLPEWNEGYRDQVRQAVREWDEVGLPVRFAFTGDSARADVHVSFVDHFDEPISGRTKWARDDDWWITDADITLAVHHRAGHVLDEDAMRAMALHELGHLLGLDHTEDATSIMAPKVRVRTLSPADLATVRLLYTLPPGGVR